MWLLSETAKRAVVERRAALALLQVTCGAREDLLAVFEGEAALSVRLQPRVRVQDCAAHNRVSHHVVERVVARSRQAVEHRAGRRQAGRDPLEATLQACPKLTEDVRPVAEDRVLCECLLDRLEEFGGLLLYVDSRRPRLCRRHGFHLSRSDC
jgi:hypothetical protein